VDIDHYSQVQGQREELEQREKIVLREIVPIQGKILDVGCGDGCFLSHIVKRFPDLAPTGVDLSPGQLEKARTRLPQGRFTQGTLGAPLPFSDREFDIVYCGEVLEHLYDPDFLLKEVFRVLKPQGRLYLTTPNLMAWYNRLLILVGLSPLFVEYSTQDSSVGYGPLKKLKYQSQPAGHLRIYHPAALRDIQTLHGFRNLDVCATGFEHFPKSIRWIDQALASLWTGGGSILVSSAVKP
jgi:SAM-dependent methyltransferase